MADTTYATLAELKARVSVAADDTSNDTLLQQILNSAAWLVDRYTRQARAGYEAFSESASETRYFADEGLSYLAIDDATVVTAVAIGVTAAALGGTALSSSDWAPDPWQGTPVSLPVQGLFLSTVCAGRVAVTGKWGYCAAANRPAIVTEATLMQAAFMVAHVGKPDAGAKTWTELHELVAGMLTPLVRRVWVV